MGVQAVLSQLVGQRCEGADNPYGSILRFDIGEMAKPLDDPDAHPHGWRHLTVLSPWRLESASEVLGDWNLEGGAHGSIGQLIQQLRGQMVRAVRSSGPSWDLVIEWESGLRLCVFSDSNDDRDDAWFILGTDGLELSVGPAHDGDPGWNLKGGSRAIENGVL